MSSGKTCDSHCHYIVCGDGVREDTEQCDDGNTTNLDGCDSSCKFEQDQRANSLDMSFDTTVCTPNALGTAIVDTTTAQPQLQTALTDGVKDGTDHHHDEVPRARRPDRHVDDESVHARLPATPRRSAGTGYDGTSDLDWWYTTDPISIDGTRNPTTSLIERQVRGGGKLTADPGTLALEARARPARRRR